MKNLKNVFNATRYFSSHSQKTFFASLWNHFQQSLPRSLRQFSPKTSSPSVHLIGGVIIGISILFSTSGCSRTFDPSDSETSTILNIELTLTFNGSVDPNQYNYIIALRTTSQSLTQSPLNLPNSNPIEFLPTPGIEFNTANDIFLTKPDGLDFYYTQFFSSWSSYITYYKGGIVSFFPAVSNPNLSPLEVFPQKATEPEHLNFGTFPLNATIKLENDSDNPNRPGITIPNAILKLQFQTNLIADDAQYVHIGVITTQPNSSDISANQYGGVVVDSTQTEHFQLNIKLDGQEPTVIFNPLGVSGKESADIIKLTARIQ